MLILAILRSKRRFHALREFTLESGQAELERMKLEKKEADELESLNLSRQNSLDTARGAGTAAARAPSLSDVPEENAAFAIGDDDDDDDDDEGHDETPVAATDQAHVSSSQHSVLSARSSRTPSVDYSASTDDAVPLQLRGMSEKARGKMPAGQPSFSRQNSTTSLNSLTPSTLVGSGLNFIPTADWVCILIPCRT
ncbi:MAG: hypothetical protein INR71_07265 [Terriglobus roseus]|nr:hypothetical protein [Terriglobus roseus]